MSGGSPVGSALGPSLHPARPAGPAGFLGSPQYRSHWGPSVRVSEPNAPGHSSSLPLCSGNQASEGADNASLLIVGPPSLLLPAPPGGRAIPQGQQGPWEGAQAGSVPRARQASGMHCGNIARVRPEHAMQLQCTTAARSEACVGPRRCPGRSAGRGRVQARVGSPSKAGLGTLRQLPRGSAEPWPAGSGTQGTQPKHRRRHACLKADKGPRLGPEAMPVGQAPAGLVCLLEGPTGRVNSVGQCVPPHHSRPPP